MHLSALVRSGSAKFPTSFTAATGTRAIVAEHIPVGRRKDHLDNRSPESHCGECRLHRGQLRHATSWRAYRTRVVVTSKRTEKCGAFLRHPARASLPRRTLHLSRR